MVANKTVVDGICYLIPNIPFRHLVLGMDLMGFFPTFYSSRLAIKTACMVEDLSHDSGLGSIYERQMNLTADDKLEGTPS